MKIFLKIKKYIRLAKNGAYVTACAIGYFLNKYFPEEPKKSFAQKQWDEMCSSNNVVGDASSPYFMMSNRNLY